MLGKQRRILACLRVRRPRKRSIQKIALPYFNYGGGVGACPVSLFTIIQIPDRFVNIFIDRVFTFSLLARSLFATIFLVSVKKVDAWTFGLRCSIG